MDVITLAVFQQYSIEQRTCWVDWADIHSNNWFMILLGSEVRMRRCINGQAPVNLAWRNRLLHKMNAAQYHEINSQHSRHAPKGRHAQHYVTGFTLWNVGRFYGVCADTNKVHAFQFVNSHKNDYVLIDNEIWALVAKRSVHWFEQVTNYNKHLATRSYGSQQLQEFMIHD